MSRCSLFHELREHTCGVGVFPVVRHLLKNLLPDRLPSPERYQPIAVHVAHSLAHLKGDSFPRVENMQILKRMATEFGIRIRGFRGRSAFTYDEFTVVDGNPAVLHDMLECQGTFHRHGDKAGLFIGFRHKKCTFRRQIRNGMHALFAQLPDAFCHGLSSQNH